jgi:hypothetical protein
MGKITTLMQNINTNAKQQNKNNNNKLKEPKGLRRKEFMLFL